MKITLDWLIEKEACEESVLLFKNQKVTDSTDILKALINSDRSDRLDWANWLIVRVMERKQYLRYAIFAAEQVLDIFEKKYPKDKLPRKAIEAARKCLEDDTEVNKKFASAYASAAYAYASAAYASAASATYASAYPSAAATYAAYASASAAAAAAYASATHASAAYAAYASSYASSAAYASASASAYASVSASHKMKLKILIYGMGLLDKRLIRDLEERLDR